MATFAELIQASENTILLQKVQVATWIAATTVMAEATSVDNHANRLAWAKTVFADPKEAGAQMVWPVLAQNKGAALAAITGASDATVQTAVDAAVNVFAQGV